MATNWKFVAAIATGNSQKSALLSFYIVNLGEDRLFEKVYHMPTVREAEAKWRTTCGNHSSSKYVNRLISNNCK